MEPTHCLWSCLLLEGDLHVTLTRACSPTWSEMGAWPGPWGPGSRLPPHIVVLWPVARSVGRDH